MVEDIKTIFYIIPILGVVIKVIDDLFIEVVKSKYSSTPGKMGAYSRVISFGGRLLVAIEVVAVAVLVINYFCNKGNINNNTGTVITNTIVNGWDSFIGFIFALALVGNMFITLVLFPNIERRFIYVLENNQFEPVSEVNCIKKYFKSNKGIKLVTILNGGLSYINLAIYTIFLVVYYILIKEDPSKLAESMYSISIVTIYILFCIITAVLSNSLKKAFSDLMQGKEYIFSCNNGEQYIKTKLYLDYKDDYLVMKDGYEIWLPKSNTTRKIVKPKK